MELGTSFRKPAVDSLADELNKNVYNIDYETKFDLSEEMDIDNKIYGKYKEDYLKINGTPNSPFWKVASDSIEEIIFRRGKIK